MSLRKDSEELKYPGILWNLFGSKECLPFSSRTLTLCSVRFNNLNVILTGSERCSQINELVFLDLSDLIGSNQGFLNADPVLLGALTFHSTRCKYTLFR